MLPHEVHEGLGVLGRRTWAVFAVVAILGAAMWLTQDCDAGPSGGVDLSPGARE